MATSTVFSCFLSVHCPFSLFFAAIIHYPMQCNFSYTNKTSSSSSSSRVKKMESEIHSLSAYIVIVIYVYCTYIRMIKCVRVCINISVEKTPSYTDIVYLNKLSTSDLIFILRFYTFSFRHYVWFCCTLYVYYCYCYRFVYWLRYYFPKERVNAYNMHIAIIFTLSQINFGFYYKCCNFLVRFLRRRKKNTIHKGLNHNFIYTLTFYCKIDVFFFGFTTLLHVHWLISRSQCKCVFYDAFKCIG